MFISARLVTKRLPKMFSTARVLPVKASVTEDSVVVVVVAGFSVLLKMLLSGFSVVFFFGLIGGILMSGNFATGLRNGGRRFGFLVVVVDVSAGVLVVEVRGLNLEVWFRTVVRMVLKYIE